MIVTSVFFKGPSSTSECISQMGGIDIIGQNNVDNYNIISIDQVRQSKQKYYDRESFDRC